MSEIHWDPERFRAELTDEKIIKALSCYMPTAAYKGPPMPTTICIEEAIKWIRAYRDLREKARAVVETVGSEPWHHKSIDDLAAALGRGEVG